MRLWKVAGFVAVLGCARTSLEALEPLEPLDEGATGGVPTGGRGTGGGATGGSDTGGVATGGSGLGGVPSGGVPSGGVSTGGSAGAGASGGSEPPAYALVGSPLVVAPTSTGFIVNAVLAAGAVDALRAEARPSQTSATWDFRGNASYPASDVVEWSFEGLREGTTYQYRVIARDPTEGDVVLYTGKATTARPRDQSFAFALITDTHIPPRSYVPLDLSSENFQEETLIAVADDLRAANPDFMLNLGDTLDYHMFGFNDPPPDASWARLAYLNYRRLFGATLGVIPHFPVIGNWDGENGCNSEEQQERSRPQRKLYLPGPKPDRYPEGGGVNEDYYAFTWGDALFVVLNVMTYTEACHYLSYDYGLPDDWTLGEAQLAWLERTLQNSTSRWRFTFIHHTVGGAAADFGNSAYGRGGGQAAHIGEQAIIHDMLLRYGVQIFFYGHDHVFTDMTVDNVHYTLPGSAGAPWKFTQAETGYQTFWPDSGYALVHVSTYHVVVDFVAQGGTVLSSYQIDTD